MLNAIFTAALLTLAVGEPQSVKIDDNTDVKLTLRKDALQIVWNCMEKNMEYVNSFYKKPRWNVWAGEAVDCTFASNGVAKSTVVAVPNYRQLTNPSNNFFTAFYGKPRPASLFTSKTVRSDKAWTVEWIIPFAGLETSKYPDAASEKVIPPGNVWTFKFSRRCETGGKKTLATTPVVVVQLPKEVMEPYRQIMLTNYKGAKTAKAGVSQITCTLRNATGKEFTGKAKLCLLANKEVSVLKEIAVKVPAKGTMKIDEQITLPEKAAKFHIRTVVENQNGLPVRISYDLPIENPWVEF